MLDATGEIDRKTLASEVFASPERLAQLNAIVHPAVIRREEEFLRAAELADPSGVGDRRSRNTDRNGKLPAIRQADRGRLHARTADGARREAGRLHAGPGARPSEPSMPMEEKRRYADYIIDTSGTKENTVEQTTAVYQSLRSLER